MTEKQTETATYEVTGPVGGVPVVLTADEAAGYVFAGWVGGEHEANRKTGRLKIQEAYDGTARVGDKHPQDRWDVQHEAWERVWEAARACEDFRDFKEKMDDQTYRLRWTETREDEERDETPTVCTTVGCGRTRPRWTMTVIGGHLVCSPTFRMHCAECCKPGESLTHYTEEEHRHGDAVLEHADAERAARLEASLAPDRGEVPPGWKGTPEEFLARLGEISELPQFRDNRDVEAEAEAKRNPLTLPDASPEVWEQVKAFQGRDQTSAEIDEAVARGRNPQGPGFQWEADTFQEVAAEGDLWAHGWLDGARVTLCGKTPKAVLNGPTFLGIWCPDCHGHIGTD
jgi:hypothetical protein